MSGVDQEYVTGLDGDVLTFLGGAQVVGGDRVARVEPRDPLGRGDVEQDSAADDALLGLVHRELRRATDRGGVGGVEAVVVLALPGEVGQPVEVGVRSVADDADVFTHRVELDGVAEHVARFAELHVALQHRSSAQRVGIGGIHVSGQRDHVAVTDGGRCGGAFLGGDQVERAESVVVTPTTPVGQCLKVIPDVLLGRAVHAKLLP